MSRGLENRNPGNIRQSRVRYKARCALRAIRSSSSSNRRHGATGPFSYCSTPTAGGHGLRSLREMISRWAPPSENRTEAYIRAVADDTGIDPDEPINTRDRKTMVPSRHPSRAWRTASRPTAARSNAAGSCSRSDLRPKGAEPANRSGGRTPAAERRTDGHGARKEGKTAGQRPPERTESRRRSRRVEKTGTNASAAGKPGPGGGFASKFAIFASEQTIHTCRSGSYSHGSTGCRC